MVHPVQVRPISNDEGMRLLRIVRRGTGSVVTWRRAQMVLLSAQGMPVAKIAEVTFTSPDRVRDRARAKSALRGLTCGYGGQRPKSGLLSHRCALYLHGEHSAHVQVSATRRSVCRSDGPELAADRRLSTPV